MGAGESKQWEEGIQWSVTEAARRQESSRVLDVFLEHYFSLVSNAWKEVPKTTRAKIQGTQNRTKKTFLRSEKRVTPSGDVKLSVERLKESPSAVLDNSYEEGLLSCPRDEALTRNPLCKLFLAAYRLQQRRTISKIQFRFATVSLFRCKSRLRRTRLHDSPLSDLAHMIAVSGLTSLSEDEIHTRAQALIQAGARYNSLAQELGEGCLFTLPDDIPASEFERMSLTGKTHTEVINLLKNGGILERSQDVGADAVAKGVLEYISYHLAFVPDSDLAFQPSVSSTSEQITGSDNLNILASVAEARNSSTQPQTFDIQDFNSRNLENNNGARTISRQTNNNAVTAGMSLLTNPKQSETNMPQIPLPPQLRNISGTETFAYQSRDHSITRFGLDHQNIERIAALQQQNQGMEGFNAETDFNLQDLSPEIASQQQEAFNAAMNLEMSTFSQTVMSQQIMEGFNAERDFDPQQLTQQARAFGAAMDCHQRPVEQQHSDHEMGGFNAEKDFYSQPPGQQEFNFDSNVTDLSTSVYG